MDNMLRYIACHLDGYSLESEGVSTAVFAAKHEQLSKRALVSDLRTSKQSQNEIGQSLDDRTTKKKRDEDGETILIYSSTPSNTNGTGTNEKQTLLERKDKASTQKNKRMPSRPKLDSEEDVMKMQAVRYLIHAKKKLDLTLQ